MWGEIDITPVALRKPFSGEPTGHARSLNSVRSGAIAVIGLSQIVWFGWEATFGELLANR